jgi:hypothetical protein
MEFLRMETAMERPVDATIRCDKATVFGDRIKGKFLIHLSYIFELY